MAGQQPRRTPTFSKRATILAAVLDWINSGCYETGDDYILFGRESAYDLIDDLTRRDQEPNPDRQALQELVSDVMIHSGRSLAASRTSLDAAPMLSELRGVETLSPEARQQLIEFFQNQLTRAKSVRIPGRPEATSESLDANYAKEVVQGLEDIVRRATLLDPHSVRSEAIGDPDVRMYFVEAHRCFLYGFLAACAVMCRALLEREFNDRVKLDSAELARCREQKKSEFRCRVEKSGLSDSLQAAALRVRAIGNIAAHKYSEFQDLPEDEIAEALSLTLDVLAALYPEAA